jgi:hypothetical protein
MFHAEDHLRFTGASQPLAHARVRRGLRVEARNTDVNALFDRIGLSHLARRA